MFRTNDPSDTWTITVLLDRRTVSAGTVWLLWCRRPRCSCDLPLPPPDWLHVTSCVAQDNDMSVTQVAVVLGPRDACKTTTTFRFCYTCLFSPWDHSRLGHVPQNVQRTFMYFIGWDAHPVNQQCQNTARIGTGKTSTSVLYPSHFLSFTITRCVLVSGKKWHWWEGIQFLLLCHCLFFGA